MAEVQLEMAFESPKTLSTAEVAKILEVTQTCVGIWAKEGLFPHAFKRGVGPRAPWRIPKSDLDAFIEARRKEQGYFYLTPGARQELERV